MKFWLLKLRPNSLQIGRKGEVFFDHISNQVMEEAAKQKHEENKVNFWNHRIWAIN